MIRLLRRPFVGAWMLSVAACAAAPSDQAPVPASPLSVASPEAAPAAPAAPVAARPSASQPRDLSPEYVAAFPRDRVPTFTIRLSPADWQAMQADMTDLFGKPTGQYSKSPVLAARNPMWVRATVTYEDETWTDLGVRFKGNSSLQEAWATRKEKLPFKVDFTQFDKADPKSTKDRKFHGFKQLALSTHLADPTFMRDALAYDVLHDAGLAAAESGFYTVMLDHGSGPRRLGLYSAIEVIDDTVVKRHFGSDSGNIYEADGPAASLTAQLAGPLEASFQKENNKSAADWGDIQGLYDALHAPDRTTNAAAWRQRLERRFDVDGFMRWQAFRALMQNGDTYGTQPHNFYLYNNPATQQLTWIGWDYNMVLQLGWGVVVPFDQKPSKAWPLIGHMRQDPTYHAAYRRHLAELLNGPFHPDVLEPRVAAYAALLSPHAAPGPKETPYSESVAALTGAIRKRRRLASDYLAKPD